MTSGPITSSRWGESGMPNFIFFSSQITADCDCSHNIKRRLLLGRKAMTNLHTEGRDITLLTKVQIVKAIVFPCMDMRVGPWRLSAEELMLWTLVLEKTLESPLDSKEMKLVIPIGNQPWIFLEKTHVETDAPTLWLSDVKSQLTGKDPDAGKDGGQEKGATEDDIVGWHHRLKGNEFAQTQGDSEGQGSLACCSPWGCKDLDMTLQLNNSNKKSHIHISPPASFWTSLVAQTVKNLPVMPESLQCGRPGSIPRLGWSPGEGNGYPLLCSRLENSMERGAWQATGHGVAKSRTRLRDFHSLTHSLCEWKLHWAANTINVYCSLFQINLLFQDIFINWFSPKVFPPLLRFLFVILLLFLQVWSAALISQKEFQFPSMVFGFYLHPLGLLACYYF